MTEDKDLKIIIQVGARVMHWVKDPVGAMGVFHIWGDRGHVVEVTMRLLTREEMPERREKMDNEH